MLTRLLILLLPMLVVARAIAQPGPFVAADLPYAVNVCSDTAFTPPVIVPDLGDVQDLGPNNRGCLVVGERNGIWINFTVPSSGRIGFTVIPTAAADYDLGVWGPFTERPDTLLTTPIRCS